MKNRILQLISSGYLFILGAAILGFSCSEENYDNVVLDDLNAPAIWVDDIADDTLFISYSDAGNYLSATYSDETGLGTLNLSIDSTDVAIISVDKQLEGTQVYDTIDVSGLELNTPYEVSITLTDDSENVQSLDFVLVVSLEMGPPAPYSEIYIVGDASPSGWNIGTPEAFTVKPTDSWVFTFTGSLTAGEIKFSTFAGDWCDGQWLNASVADQSISVTDYIVTNGCDGPDNKWRVQAGEEGTYQITIDLSAEMVTFVKQ